MLRGRAGIPAAAVGRAQGQAGSTMDPRPRDCNSLRFIADCGVVAQLFACQIIDYLQAVTPLICYDVELPYTLSARNQE